MLGFKKQKRPKERAWIPFTPLLLPPNQSCLRSTANNSGFWWSHQTLWVPGTQSTLHRAAAGRQNLPAVGLGKWKAFWSELIIYNPRWLSMQPLPASSVLSAFVQRLRKQIKDGKSVLSQAESGRACYRKTKGNVLQNSNTWVLDHLMPLMYLFLWNCAERRGDIILISPSVWVYIKAHRRTHSSYSK